MNGDTWKPLTETQAASSGPIDPQVNTTHLLQGLQGKGGTQSNPSDHWSDCTGANIQSRKAAEWGGGTQEVGPTEGGRSRIQEPPSHTALGLRAETMNWPKLTS